MTNWFKGIDEALSTAGGTQVALAGYYFVDVINGDDSTGDGSPSNPWKTLTFAITQNVSSANYVLASGLYSETNLTSFNNDQILANIDGSVIFDSGSVANDSTFEGCVFKGFTLSSSAIDITLNSCVLDAITLNVSTITLSKTVAIAPTFTISTACSWGYSTITGTGTVAMSGNITVTNCDLGTAINFSGSNNALVSYSNNRPTTQTNITDSGNNIDLDPLYTGATADLELTIQTTSPLIGAGENGTTIGAFKVGELVDFTGAVVNNNITLGATIEITNPATTGNIKPALKTFDQVRKSPIVQINGLPDNFDNIPDNETTLIPPKRNTVNVLWRESVGGLDYIGEFLYGVPMLQDDAGNKTGEDDFNIFNLSSTGSFDNLDSLTSANLLTVAQIQPNFVINDFVPFISSWKTDNAGTSANDEITIPFNLIDGTAIIDWGDGNIENTKTASDLTHTYSSTGTYTVKIYGNFGFGFSNTGDPQKLLQISQWSNYDFTTNSCFWGCSNLTITATDVPKISTTTFSDMFRSNSSLTAIPSIGSWDVSSVTTYERTWRDCTVLNESGLSSLNVSTSNINMLETFMNCDSLNVSLNSWDVSNVTNFAKTFSGCNVFNGNVISWDVSNGTIFTQMFQSCPVFNQNIGGWITSSATTMQQMFRSASVFNQNISTWNVSGVSDFSGMFKSASSFNQDISAWTFSASNIDMSEMFRSANAFNQLLTWTTTNVVNMSFMFASKNYNQDITGANLWDMSNVTNIGAMFFSNDTFNQDISLWDTSSVTSMGSLFQSAGAINQDLGGMDISSVTNMNGMFDSCGATFTTVNLDACLNGWAAQAPSVQSGVVFSATGVNNNSRSTASDAAVTTLTTTYGWTISTEP